jgi:hypothetical protein
LNANVATKLYKSARDFLRAAIAAAFPRWRERMVYAVAAGVGKVSFWWIIK